MTGLLVPPDDASALGAALSQLLEDPVTSKEMGLKGLEKCRRYTASQVSAELETRTRGWCQRPSEAVVTSSPIPEPPSPKGGPCSRKMSHQHHVLTPQGHR